MDGIPSSETIGGPNLGIEGIGGLVLTIINLLILINIAAGFIFFLIGGLQFITAGGDQNKLAKAKNSLTYSVLGIVLALIAVSLTIFLGDFFGMDVSFLRQ